MSSIHQSDGPVVRASPSQPKGRGPSPVQVIPKTLKLYPLSPCLALDVWESSGKVEHVEILVEQATCDMAMRVGG